MTRERNLWEEVVVLKRTFFRGMGGPDLSGLPPLGWWLRLRFRLCRSLPRLCPRNVWIHVHDEFNLVLLRLPNAVDVRVVGTEERAAGAAGGA